MDEKRILRDEDGRVLSIEELEGVAGGLDKNKLSEEDRRILDEAYEYYCTVAREVSVGVAKEEEEEEAFDEYWAVFMKMTRKYGE